MNIPDGTPVVTAAGDAGIVLRICTLKRNGRDAYSYTVGLADGRQEVVVAGEVAPACCNCGGPCDWEGDDLVKCRSAACGVQFQPSVFRAGAAGGAA